MVVFTGDVQNAGTDAQVSLTVFGTNGCSKEIVLDKNGDRFERGREDLVKVRLTYGIDKTLYSMN